MAQVTKLEELEYAFWNGNPPTELWKQNDAEEFMNRYFVENPLVDERGPRLPFIFRWLLPLLKSIGSFSFNLENVVAVLVLLLILYFAVVLLLLLFQTVSRLVGTIAVSILLSTLLIWLISKTR
ncbi:Chaperone protein DnaJ [Galdieria sulphuraria]|nr:Chaperone protein DnaJ [Galdieria sulphuraria]